MNRKEQIIFAAIGLLIATCGCIAAWLVVPQFQNRFSPPLTMTSIPSNSSTAMTFLTSTPTSENLSTPTGENTPTPTNTLLPTTTTIPSPTISPTASISLPFNDNFDNGINSNWKVIAGTWRTVDGKLIADAGRNPSEIIVGDENWRNYIIEFDVYSKSAAGFPIGVIVRSMDGNHLLFKTDCCNTEWILIAGTSEQTIAHLDDGGLVFALQEFTISHVRVEVIDQTFTGYINGRQFLRVTDTTNATGAVGIMSDTPHENRLLFDNFVVALP